MILLKNQNILGFIIILGILFIKLTLCLDFRSEIQSQGQREAKFFPFLAIINYDYGLCTVNGREGSCIPHSQCENKGDDAVDLGVCAQVRYGTCCEIKKRCSNSAPVTVYDNQTFILSPEPGRMNSICQFIIPKKRDVCQIRLDFIDTFIGTPNFFGNCPNDGIIVSGMSNLNELNSFQACGNLSGQHMYLAYGEESEQITLKIKLREIGPNSRYRIKVTQLKCSAYRKVPDHCFQYFTNETEEIRSFGYPIQLNNQIYTICIDPPGTSIGVKLNFQDFFVSGRSGQQPMNNDCSETNDYVQVFGQHKPLCWTRKLSPLIEIKKPYLLHVHFDEKEGIEPIDVPQPQGGWTDATCHKDLLGPMYGCMFRNPKCICEPVVTDNNIDIENRGFLLHYTP